MHTNPIILTFCSILYYKDLNEHLNRYKLEKKFSSIAENDELDLQIKKFNGFLLHPNTLENKRKRIYNKRIVNKWHLILCLCQNPQLVLYRKEYIAKLKLKKQIKEKISIFQKIKLKLIGLSKKETKIEKI